MRPWIPALLLGFGCGARSQLEIGEATTTTPQGKVTAIAAHALQSWALTEDGRAWCWGQAASQTDQLYQLAPIEVSAPAGIAALSAGMDQACAVLHDGTLECWGGNEVNQSGTITPMGNTAPPTPIATGVVSASAGEDYACAVVAGGTALCWGMGEHGQLGNAAAPSFNETMPTPVQGGAALASISASRWMTCGIGKDHGVVCWGSGFLGDGTTTPSTLPVPVQGLTGPVTQLAVGDQHACALLKDGTVMCWGDGSQGQLGLGPQILSGDVAQPIPAVSPARAISSGNTHSCAVLVDGTAQCWGTQSPPDQIVWSPSAVPGLSGVTAIASGLFHDCALLESRRVVCWGDNTAGALGNGDPGTMVSATPVEVKGLP